ncbi:hypothetical protein N7470_002086 [Penicillium chermesinum]|nr:hypothetical protein N7470_002086 [Penicillium chermesinum]
MSIRRIQRLPACASLPRSTITLPSHRSFAQSASKSSNEDKSSQKPAKDDKSPNHPIPSNKAHPTLNDGRVSPMADMDGKLKEDLPHDVKRHNADMENRYDRPYNHISDEGRWRKLL